MGRLIAQNHDLSKITSDNTLIEFSMTKPKSALREKKRKLPEKKKQIQPPKMKALKPAMSKVSNLGVKVDVASLIGDFGADGQSQGSSEIQPIIRIKPQYPTTALMRGQEGWVILEFTVTEKGTVKNPRVVKSHPPNIFDRDALRAVSKWRYNPQKENGKPVSVVIKTQLDFELEDEQ